MSEHDPPPPSAMYFIQDVLVSDEVLEARFACDIGACKGACCWEGDFGAPLDAEEVEILENIFSQVRPYLDPAGIQVLEKEGTAVHYPELGKMGTPLVEGGPCAYLAFDPDGTAHCGIEKAWAAGATTFRKPISCHLYPIRVLDHPGGAFEALNYDRWSICAGACARAEREGISLVDFAREALVRKYGEAFHEELRAARENHLKG